MKRTLYGVVCIILSLVAITAGVSAYSAGESTYDYEKYSPFNTILGNAQEHVDLSTGFLVITESDLRLPGKNGLDFGLVRKYESRVADVTQPVWHEEVYMFGVGWTWDLPYLTDPNSGCSVYVGGGEKVSFRVIWDYEGSEIVSFQMNTFNNPFAKYELKNYTSGAIANARYVLRNINTGINYYFDVNGKIVRIQNRYGDSISYTWGTGANYLTVKDTVGRIIKFDYSSSTLYRVSVNSPAGAREIKYYRSLVGNKYKLDRVEYPEGVSLGYAYTTKETESGRYVPVNGPGSELELMTQLNTYLLLNTISNPYGGITTFTFTEPIFKRKLGGAGSPYSYYCKVQSRRDSVGSNISYEYINHDYSVSSSADYKTAVNYGERTEVYAFGKTGVNKSVLTTSSANPGYRETKTITYTMNVPIYTETTKENTGSGAKLTTWAKIGYDSLGNVTYQEDSYGHISEASYRTIVRADTDTEFRVPEWSRKRVNRDGQGALQYVKQFNTYDTSGNLQSTEERELTSGSTGLVETVKATTYYIYTNPSRSGLPGKIHTEYGVKGAFHRTGTAMDSDACVKVEYQYDDAAFDNQLAGEDFSYVLPTKTTQYYTNADGVKSTLVTELRYDRYGNMTGQKVGTLGNNMYLLENQYTYDGLNRLKTEVIRDTNTKVLQKNYTYTLPFTAGYAATTISHQSMVGSVISGANQHVTGIFYNKMGQPIEVRKGPNGELLDQKIQYDAYGRKEYVIDGNGLKTQTVYDGCNRPVEIRSYSKSGTYPAYKKIVYDDPANLVTEEIYERKNGVFTRVGKAVTQLDQAGHTVYTKQYPVATGATAYRTSYTYNLAGQVTGMTDPRGVTLSYEYGIFGLTRVTYPGNIRGDENYVYEYPGNVKQVKKQISGSGSITTEYDEMNRVRKVTDIDGRVMKNYYDQAGRLIRSSLTASMQNTEIAYEYDVTGNIKKARHTCDGRVFEVSYGYNEVGNVTNITYPGGYTVSYEYDLYDRVIRVPQFVEGLSAGETYPGTTPPPGGGGGTNPRKPDPGEIIIDDPYPIDPRAVGSTAVSYAPMAAPSSLPGVRYKANGFMEALKFANGITTFFVDDPMGRIQTISSPVYELTYGYDGKGNVTSITGNNGVAVASSYTYSDNDWLVGAAQGQNVYAYAYDAAGNCIRKTVNGVQTTYTYDLPHLNLLSKVNDKTVAHDARGNMILRNDTGYSYIYDQSGQLKEVWKSGASCGKYFYNNEGKRYKKVENGLSTYYVYGGESLLYELKPDGMIIYYIDLNGRQVAKVEREGAVDRKYFYHTDHLGSTRAITNEQGVVVGRFEYQPYGLEETTVTGDDTLTFTGKMMDDPTGLMYFNARYYDPTLGRFTTEDPAKDGGNWYIYCNNGPLKYIDPTGESYILVVLPQDRSQKGILILFSGVTEDRAKMNLAFDVLGKGRYRDRTKKDADTPLGIYKFTGFISGGDSKSYGPGKRLGMTPVDGEALTIEQNGTRDVSTIRIHGGDLKESGDLRPTYGCIRATNGNMQILVNEIKYLTSMGDRLEYIYVIQGDVDAIVQVRSGLKQKKVFIEAK